MGALFFALFGGAWLGLWAFRSFAHPVPVEVGVAVGTVILAATAYRIFRANALAMRAESATPQGRRRSRLFNGINALQWILIMVLGNVLVNMGLSPWIIPMAIFLIGLHLLPLARLFANPPHFITGTALMVLAVTYPLTASLGADDPIGCLGAGLILWASALWATRPRRSLA